MSHAIADKRPAWDESHTHPPAQAARQFVRLSRLRKLRECEQVAAVCYRERSRGIEFLLIRTRGSGRWTFPKGNAEPGMTHAQAAALEAFEEAGVHGRIEEHSFIQYVSRKRDPGSTARAAAGKLSVQAHLCQVSRLGNPKESNRRRTWFSVEHAHIRLRKGRTQEEGDEFARVIEKAVERIRGLRLAATTQSQWQGESFPAVTRRNDPLYKACFDAPAEVSLPPLFQDYVRGARRATMPFAGGPARKVLECEILPFAPPQESAGGPAAPFAARKKPKALGTGVRE